MSSYRTDTSSLLDQWAPEAKEKLQASPIKEIKRPNERELTEAIVEARVETGLVRFGRSDIQQRLDIPDIAAGTITNRLRELVELGILCVDTTPNAYQYTLAVPLAESAVPLDVWQKDLESFRSTALEDIPARSPSHAELPVESPESPDPKPEPEPGMPTTQHLMCASTIMAPTTTVSSNSTRLYAVFGNSDSASTNQYAPLANIFWSLAAVSVLCAIVAVSLFGSPPVGLSFLFIGLGLFSIGLPMSLAASVTSAWADPVDIRPGDLISICD